MTFSIRDRDGAAPGGSPSIPARVDPRASASPPPIADYVSDDVDDASECSFPASDPPGWNTLQIGPPSDRSP